MTDIKECGSRPPASPSCRLYEPEAGGAIVAYAPEGMRNAEPYRNEKRIFSRRRNDPLSWKN